MKQAESYKTRSSKLGKPEAGRFCGCGRPARRSQFYCGDECRFWAKVNKGPGCWLWTGNRAGGGTRRAYGQFTLWRDGKQVHIGAHVYAYELANGPVPAGQEILHSCDTPLCVRNDGFAHVHAGTREKNVAEAVERRRYRVQRPKRQRLTTDQIYALRARVASGEAQFIVARDYGISETLVSLLMQGKRRQYDAPLSVPLRQVG